MLTAPRSALVTRLRRRQALRLGIGGGIAIVLAEFGGAFGAFFRPLRQSPFGGIVEAGPIDDILAYFRDTDDAPFLVTKGRYYLLHAPDGLLAAYRVCTHLGCVYRFEPSENQFHCPCHSSLFDRRTGVVLGGPAMRPLDLFPVQIVDGVVAVNTDPRQGNLLRRTGYDAGQATPAP
ncbi:MAG: hypothetical protein AUH85_10990 [Chloroflexi bacterium 13_1_40CM_4_68_4]|nr:MAG: hypothetical protein AUH85_10990 [Chloroflexi bacterium 13_1_40CM_4_68_4]